MRLIKNVSIFTGGEDKEYIENGAIKFNEKILKIYRNEKEVDNECSEIIDGKGKLLLPGFIISHDHLYSVLARGLGIEEKPPRNFYEILDKLWWKLDLALDRESIYYSALIGMIDAIKSGVTTIIDHHASYGYILYSLDEIERAQKELNIRVSTCFEVSDRWGEEKSKESIKENLRFIEKHMKKVDKMVAPTFGIHALFTINEKTLKDISDIGKSLNTSFHVHLAEDRFDRDYNIRLFNKSPVERLYQENMLNKKTLLIHCVHIDKNDRELIKEKDSIVIHNPESNMNNAVGLPDIFSILNKNILVGLGTDGFTQDIIREADLLYIAHKHNKMNPNIGFNESYKLIFENNPKIAERIFEEKIGVIRENYVSDFILLDYKPPTPINSDNFFGHFIFGLSSRFVTDVFINGKEVLKNREILGVDEERVFKESQKVAKKLWERFESL
jgi:putative selenium metabolism protein SsnA